MSAHHKDASVAVAQTLFDGMSPAVQAEVQAEADREGVNAVEIVRRSLDILIARSNPAAPRGRTVEISNEAMPERTTWDDGHPGTSNA